MYHDLVPVICELLSGDRHRIRTALLTGSLLPLAMFLTWNAVTLAIMPSAVRTLYPVQSSHSHTRSPHEVAANSTCSAEAVVASCYGTQPPWRLASVGHHGSSGTACDRPIFYGVF